MNQILLIFLILKIVQYSAERWLGTINHKYYSNPKNQSEVCKALNINQEDFQKTLAYTNDKYKFSRLQSWFSTFFMLVIIAIGAFGYIENLAKSASNYIGGESITTGLIFFGIFGLFSTIVELPLDYYNTFVIEEKHGFNKQKPFSFFTDKLKGLALAVILGGLLISGILYVMEKMGESWWVWAWIVMSGFSLFAAWIFPTLLAPLFNKFEPLKDGELKDQINNLSDKIGFSSGGLFVMDASKRSSHGNAYFTGFFKEKRIVLFDTLMESLSNTEVVAVLAHELGHFKLNHVRWMLIRSIALTGVMFYFLSICLPLESFYKAFYMDGVSNYGALLIFSLWFGILDSIFQPLSSWMSRKNEFAADAFAKSKIKNPNELCDALLKLRESNHSMPISHPIYSAYYYSHPPLMERLSALKS